MIKVSSKVQAEVWQSLRELAAESHQSMAWILTEAIREYVARRRVRPVVLDELERSIEANRELGKRLAE
jgi:predicted transcriptional regulator